MKKIYETPTEYLDIERTRRKTYTSYNKKREFIAYDGEGLNLGNEHKYVLLANSKMHVLEEYGGDMSTVKAFQFLLDEMDEYPEAIHVGYGIGYDVNMILNGRGREFSYKHIQMLTKNKRVFWNNYKIEYVPRRYITISEYDKPYSDKIGTKPLRSITIWDALSFFQCSFVDALEGMFTLPERETMDVEFIKRQKERRGTFTSEDAECGLLLSYTLAECYALVNLMNKLRSNCKESGINLHRYDGAGAGATALLRDNGLTDIIHQSVNMLTSHENKGLFDAVSVAYGGGRTEMFQYGHTDSDVYHADISAAFPSAMPDLPDLSVGEWIHDKKDKDVREGEFALFKIYWDYDKSGFQTMFPFFYRSPWGEPRISYPPQGYSWVWAPEVLASLSENAMRYLKVEPLIIDKWKFIPGSDRKPFEFIRNMYEKRMEYKDMGLNGQALVTKLAMNAIPGKMAQTSGYTGGASNGVSRDRNELPPYFQLAYAGWITSHVRAEVFKVAMQYPESVIAIATDGIWSTSPFYVKEGNGLGEWEYEILKGFTSIQPGVYFTKKYVGMLSEDMYHYRGFNQGSISEREVIQAWSRGDYSVEVPTRRFVTMGSAISSGDEYLYNWCRWIEENRVLDIQQGMSHKREPSIIDGEEYPNPRASECLLPTIAKQVYRFEDNVYGYGKLDLYGESIEKYLSRKHHIPWQEEREKTERRSLLDMGESISWDIIDSEM